MSQTIDAWQADCERKIAPMRRSVDALIAAGVTEQGAMLEGFIRGVEWAIDALQLRMATGHGPEGDEA